MATSAEGSDAERSVRRHGRVRGARAADGWAAARPATSASPRSWERRLIVLLLVIGVTILRIRQLLSVHLFVGLLLVPPVLLKMSSTGYRFLRYYTGDARYRRKGPPELALRLLAPMVVLSTVVVFATGVALLFAGPSSRGTLLPIHKDSFFVWAAFMAVHVLGHLPSMSAVLRADYGASAGLSSDDTGRAGRMMALARSARGGGRAGGASHPGVRSVGKRAQLFHLAFHNAR